MDLDRVGTLLFVPANRPERFEKAATSGADCVILDLEDAVRPESKVEARAALRVGFSDIPVLVRINGEDTPWHADDMEAVFALPFAGVIVPKAELSGGLANFAEESPIPVLALIETARGIVEARQIARLAGITRLIFGSVDFCADLGCAHTREALLTARSEMVLASRLAGLPAPIDGVTTALDNADVITADARYAIELGFGGKLAIHPRQIGPIGSGLRPTDTEIAWARRVVASRGGAEAIDGAMVDQPVRIRARAILDRVAAPKQPSETN